MASSLMPWSVLLFSALCTAVPVVSFPLNSQVPPVARIGQAFSFVFAASTFASSATAEFNYTLAGAPSWLSIDGMARRIYGTPKEEDISPGDVVGVPICVIASDASGSAAMSSTLVVSRKPSPSVAMPFAAQSPSGFESFSEPSSLISHPDTAFSLQFAKQAFSDPAGNGLNYYGVTGDSAPLPAWVSFDPNKLTFAGTTPPVEALVQYPQTFALQLVASDVKGFSAASIPFSIIVGNHAITSDTRDVTLDATAGTLLSYTGLRAHLSYDGGDIRAGNVSIKTASMPSWLSLDTNTWEIRGTPPNDATSSNFTIILQDSFSDTTNLTAIVLLADSLFRASLPVLNMTAGEHFEFDINPYFQHPSDVVASVVVDTSTSIDWIRFDAGRNMIIGDPPLSLSNFSLGIIVNAKSKTTGMEGSEKLVAYVRRSTSSSTTTTSSAFNSATTTSSIGTATDTAAATPSSSTSNPGDPPLHEILLAVLVPTLLLLLAIVCIFFCCYRGRNNSSMTINRKNISGPLPGSFVVNTPKEGDHTLRTLNEMYDAEYPATPTTTSKQAHYMRRIFDGLRKSKTDIGFPKSTWPSAPISEKEYRSATDHAVKSRMDGWLSRKPPTNSYLTDVSFFEQSRDMPAGGVVVARSSGDNPPFRASPRAGPSPALTGRSIQTTPDIAYGHDGSKNPQQPQRTTKFGDFLAAGSTLSPNTSRLISPLVPQTETSASPAAKSGFLGMMRSQRKDSRRTKRDNKDVESVDVPAEVSKPTPARVSPALFGKRPSVRPGAPTPANWLSSDVAEGKAGEASLAAERKRRTNPSPLHSPEQRSHTEWTTHTRQQLQRAEVLTRDSLGISYDDIGVVAHTTSPAASPRQSQSFSPSKTWSTVFSAVEEELERQQRITTTPQSGASPGARNPRLSDASESAMDPNWEVIRENPSVDQDEGWRNSGSTQADLMSPSRWPQPRHSPDRSFRFGTAPPALGWGVEIGTASSAQPNAKSPGKQGSRGRGKKPRVYV